MTLRTQLAYLHHVHAALLSVLEYTKDGRTGFFASKMVQDAVLRNLEIIGKAVKGISEETRKRAPEVPWRRIAGMRVSSSTTTSEWTWKSCGAWSKGEAPGLVTVVQRLIAELETPGGE
jgi:uncharacterized protein with HEPN domain